MTGDSLGAALVAMYPKAHEILAEGGITPRIPPALADLPIIGSTEQDLGDVDCVVASTCIDHCAAEATQLTGLVLADLVVGLTVAQRLGVPLNSFVGCGEEIRLVPNGRTRTAGWHAVWQRIQSLVETFAVTVPRAYFNTQDDRVWDALRQQADVDRAAIADSDLDGLYNFIDDSSFPRGTAFRFYYEYYRMNIAKYRAPLIAALSGRVVTRLLVVENLQQARAIGLASAANRRAEGVPTIHLVTLPAPDRTGTVRTSRAKGADRVLLDDLRAGTADPDLPCYWVDLLQLRDALITL